MKQLGIAAMVVATVGVYWQIQSFPYVLYDDPLYVYENHHVQQGLTLEGIGWALTSTSASNWHPISWLSHMLDVELFGVEAAGRHHFSSVILHVLNSLLLLALLSSITGTFWRSLFVASIFALHPLHVESVAWVSERKDVLSQFFWLLSLWSFTRYTRYSRYATTHDRHWRSLWYAMTLGCLAFGLMSKPMLVTAPFLFLLLDYWPLDRWIGAAPSKSRSEKSRAQRLTARRLLIEKIPMILLSAVSCIVTYQVQSAGHSVIAFPLWHRFATVATAYLRYIGKALWPSDLAVLYPNHVGMWTAGQVAASVVALAIVTILVLRQPGRRYLTVGWFWFLGTLVPVVGFVGLGAASIADRYMYMPMTGLLIMLSWGSVDLLRNVARGRAILGVAALSAIAACIWLTSYQLQFWSSSRALFGRALAVTQANHVAHNNMGTALEIDGDLEGALREYREAIRVDPLYPPARINAGNIYKRLGRLDEAISTYAAVLRITPVSPDVYPRLGNALLRRGRIDEAIDHLRNAIEFLPEDVMAYHDLGLGLGMRRDYAEAISILQIGLDRSPSNAWLHTTLGNIYRAQGNIEQAVRAHRTALRFAPEAGAHTTLGVSLMSAGSRDEAIVHFREALRLDPNHREARASLERAQTRPEAEMHEAGKPKNWLSEDR